MEGPEDSKPEAVWKHPPTADPEAWRDTTQPRRPWTVGRAAMALLMFAGIYVGVGIGGCFALAGIAEITDSRIGSCGPSNTGGAVIFVLYLIGPVALIPVSFGLTWLALRHQNRRYRPHRACC